MSPVAAPRWEARTWKAGAVAEAGEGGSSAKRFPGAGSRPGATGSRVGASREAGGSGCEEPGSAPAQVPPPGLGGCRARAEGPQHAVWLAPERGRGAEPLSHRCCPPTRGLSPSTSFPSRVC